MISEIQGNCLNKIIKTFTKCQSVLVLGALVGNFDKNMTSLHVDFETQVTIGEIQWLLMAAQHRLARVGFWEASQGSEGFLEGSLDVLLTSVGAAVINGHVSNL